MTQFQRFTFVFIAMLCAALWLYWGVTIIEQTETFLAWHEQRTLATTQFATAAGLFALQTLLLVGLLRSLMDKLDTPIIKALALLLIGAYSTHFLAGVIAVLSNNSLLADIIWLTTLILSGLLALLLGIYLWKSKFSPWLRATGACITIGTAAILFIEILGLALIVIAFVTLAVYFYQTDAEPEVI